MGICTNQVIIRIIQHGVIKLKVYESAFTFKKQVVFFKYSVGCSVLVKDITNNCVQKTDKYQIINNIININRYFCFDEQEHSDREIQEDSLKLYKKENETK